MQNSLVLTQAVVESQVAPDELVVLVLENPHMAVDLEEGLICMAEARWLELGCMVDMANWQFEVSACLQDCKAHRPAAAVDFDTDLVHMGRKLLCSRKCL
jgi:hypothetical protein